MKNLAHFSSSLFPRFSTDYSAFYDAGIGDSRNKARRTCARARAVAQSAGRKRPTCGSSNYKP